MKHATLATLACLCLLPMLSPAQTPAVLHLKNKTMLRGNVVTLGPDSLTISLPGAPAPLPQPYAGIGHIEWPESDAWGEAVGAYERGEWAAAATQFTAIAAAAPATLFHPAPGNFRDRALRHLIDCHRRLRDAAKVAEAHRALNWSRLPPALSQPAPTTAVWVAIAAGDWAAARTAADAIAAAPPEDAAELALLRGRIAAATGDAASAIAHYGACYALPGAAPDLAATAIRESAALLEKLPNRKEELRALAHLYAFTLGKGKVWEGASEPVVAAFKEESTLATAAAAKPAAQPKPVAAATATASSGWVTVAQFRFEPPPPGAPDPPPAPPPGKAPGFEMNNGKWSGTDAPPDWPEAGTRVGVFTPGTSYTTLTRVLPDDARLALAAGKAVRLTFECRIPSFKHDKMSPTAPDGPLVRAGLVTAKNRGYAVQFPLADTGKGASLIADSGSNSDIFGGDDIDALTLQSESAPWHPEEDATFTVTLEMRADADGKVTVEGKAGTAAATAEGLPAIGLPELAGGRIALRMMRSRSVTLLDNFVVEVSE